MWRVDRPHQPKILQAAMAAGTHTTAAAYAAAQFVHARDASCAIPMMHNKIRVHCLLARHAEHCSVRVVIAGTACFILAKGAVRSGKLRRLTPTSSAVATAPQLPIGYRFCLTGSMMASAIAQPRDTVQMPRSRMLAPWKITDRVAARHATRTASQMAAATAPQYHEADWLSCSAYAALPDSIRFLTGLACGSTARGVQWAKDRENLGTRGLHQGAIT